MGAESVWEQGAAPKNRGGNVVDAGKPVVIQTSRSLLNAKAASTFQLTGQLLDNRMTPLVTKLDVTSDKPGTVAIDSVVLSNEFPVQTVAYLRAPARTTADSATVTFSGSGLSATSKVVVTP